MCGQVYRSGMQCRCKYRWINAHTDRQSCNFNSMHWYALKMSVTNEKDRKRKTEENECIENTDQNVSETKEKWPKKIVTIKKNLYDWHMFSQDVHLHCKCCTNVEVKKKRDQTWLSTLIGHTISIKWHSIFSRSISRIVQSSSSSI